MCMHMYMHNFNMAKVLLHSCKGWGEYLYVWVNIYLSGVNIYITTEQNKTE